MVDEIEEPAVAIDVARERVLNAAGYVARVEAALPDLEVILGVEDRVGRERERQYVEQRLEQAARQLLLVFALRC